MFDIARNPFKNVLYGIDTDMLKSLCAGDARVVLPEGTTMESVAADAVHVIARTSPVADKEYVCCLALVIKTQEGFRLEPAFLYLGHDGLRAALANEYLLSGSKEAFKRSDNKEVEE